MMDDSAYFISRTSVGQEFAKELAKLRYKNTAILALSPGGVVIAIEIAKQLHSVVGLLLLKHIYLPGGSTALGVINDRGGFTYDQSISAGQIEEFEMEYRGSIELDKINAMHALHVVGQKDMLTPQYCSGRTVIIVNDITKTGTAFKAAMDFLKPIATEKVILVSAVSKEKAADILQELGDQLLIAHRTDKDFPPEHYFANNEIPHNKDIINLMEQIILHW
jgi:predicted phosphoribosyltransferase